ncbi:MAG: hypothetical protein ACTS1Z_01420 [Parasphingopyxis sp.]|uniref:hypothetical protein n=1 Tax=Parasphingopyxis sp. TaxID=1920299 RepID=UPI003FA177B8
MRYVLSLIAAISVGIPSFASASCSGVFCGDVTIERLVVSNNGDVSIRTSGDETQLDCDPGSSLYLKFRTTDTAYAEWYAMSLTAYVQQAPITFRMIGGTGTCYVSYMFQEQ